VSVPVPKKKLTHSGSYLHNLPPTPIWARNRFIYTEVVSGISILLSLIFVIPWSGSFLIWPADIVISIMWFVAFGLLANVSPMDGIL
jgi:hypothetical protein